MHLQNYVANRNIYWIPLGAAAEQFAQSLSHKMGSQALNLENHFLLARQVGNVENMEEHFNLSGNVSSSNYDGILSLEEEDPRTLVTSYMMYKVGKLQNFRVLCTFYVLWQRFTKIK